MYMYIWRMTVYFGELIVYLHHIIQNNEFRSDQIRCIYSKFFLALVAFIAVVGQKMMAGEGWPAAKGHRHWVEPATCAGGLAASVHDSLAWSTVPPRSPAMVFFTGMYTILPSEGRERCCLPTGFKISLFVISPDWLFIQKKLNSVSLWLIAVHEKVNSHSQQKRCNGSSLFNHRNY